MATAFGIGMEWSGDTVHLSVRGELDISVSDELVDHVRAVRRSAARVALVDLCDVTFMDSSGLRALLTSQRLASESYRDFELIVVRPPAVVHDVIRMSGADRLLRFADDYG